MPRGPRIEYRGGLYHVLNRGIRREAIFNDASDYEKFIEYLSTAQKLYPFICYGYVLMPNHFHLIVERLDDSFSSIMKSLLGSYAAFYNSKYNRSGHVFQGRYHSILCQKEIYLQELIRYIHLNPIRAGFVELPDQWKWSSYNAYFGEVSSLMIDIKAVLNCFGKDINKASKKLSEFINDGIDNNETCKIYPKSVFPVLGNDTFIKNLNNNVKELRRKVDPRLRISLHDLNFALCERYKIKIHDIRGKGGNRTVSCTRAIFSYIASIYSEHKITEIARYLKKDPSAVTHAIKKIKSIDRSYEINEVREIVKKIKLSRPTPIK